MLMRRSEKLQEAPVQAALAGERFALLPLAKMIELKLASGMTAPHPPARLGRRVRADPDPLARAGAGRSDRPWVREKYLELWTAAQGGGGG